MYASHSLVQHTQKKTTEKQFQGTPIPLGQKQMLFFMSLVKQQKQQQKHKKKNERSQDLLWSKFCSIYVKHICTVHKDASAQSTMTGSKHM